MLETITYIDLICFPAGGKPREGKNTYPRTALQLPCEPVTCQPLRGLEAAEIRHLPKDSTSTQGKYILSWTRITCADVGYLEFVESVIFFFF